MGTNKPTTTDWDDEPTTRELPPDWVPTYPAREPLSEPRPRGNRRPTTPITGESL